MRSNGEHNHLLEPEEIEVKQFREVLKERVINETTPIAKIYDEEIAKAQFSSDTLASVPLACAMNSALNQTRRKRTPVLPTSTVFDIPNTFQTTSNGEKFLFCDTLVGRKKRMLLFGSPKQLELLFDSPIVFMDGTFSATPPFFDQVFTIHGFKFESGFPCAFGLLPDRKKSTYQVLFQELKAVATSMNRTFQPEQIMSDFETGLMPAVAAEFPEATHKGCYFHFQQCVYRRIQNLGLSTAYAEDEEIRSCCRKLMALSLLPRNEMENSFHNLRATLNARMKRELRQLFLYFDNYWMNDIPLEMWNAHGSEHRTNNICEAFHSRLIRRIERAHSNMWAFITCLVSEEVRFQHLHIQVSTGTQRRPKATAADAIQKRIDTLNKRYNDKEIDAEQLLNALSLLIGKKK